MKISKDAVKKIMRGNGFDNFDVQIALEDIFGEETETDLANVMKNILDDVVDNLGREKILNTSGDIKYIINYLERYLEVIIDLENIE